MIFEVGEQAVWKSYFWGGEVDEVVTIIDRLDGMELRDGTVLSALYLIENENGTHRFVLERSLYEYSE